MVRLRHRNIIRKIKEYQIIDIAQALHNTPPLSFISFFIILRNNQLSRIKTIYLFSTEILILKIFQRNIPFSFFQIFLASSKKKKEKRTKRQLFHGTIETKTHAFVTRKGYSKGGDPITKRNNGLRNQFEILIRSRRGERIDKGGPFKNCTKPDSAVVAKGRTSKKPDNGTKFKETIHWRTKAIGRRDTPTLPTFPSIIRRNFVTFVFKRVLFTKMLHKCSEETREMKRNVYLPLFIYLNRSFFYSKNKSFQFKII